MRTSVVVTGTGLGLLGVWQLPTIDQRFPVPGKLQLDLTSEIVMKLGHRPEYSRWSTNSRIDMLPVPAKDRFMFARGRKRLGVPIPEQKVIMQDGWAGTFSMNFSENPDSLKVVGIDGGSGCVTPSVESIQNGTYAPLSRPMFIYVNKASLERPEVQEFVKFYMENGAELAEEVGYVGLPAQAYQANIDLIQ